MKAPRPSREHLPAPVADDPCTALVEALGAIIRQAVRDGVAEVVSEILPHLGPPTDPTAMVDVAEAANRLGLSLSKTKRLVVAGELGSVLIGRRRKVPVSAIESYISRLEEEQLRLPGMDAAR